jgi:uncharacterized protein
MTTARPLEVSVAELLRHPGVRKPVQRDAVLDGLAVSTAAVPAGVEVELDLVVEATGGGVVAEGVVRAPWEGACRRCLEPVTGVLEADVREVFERRPTEGETYPLRDDLIDLEALARDAVLLSLPLAPLCGPGCEGPAPDLVPVVAEDDASHTAAGRDAAAGHEPARDPRWAGLDDLHFDT